MKTSNQLEILRSLASGINPYTGKEFKATSAYQHPQTVRALYAAINALERVDKIEAKQKHLPKNSGSYWTSKEERKMIKAHEDGNKVAQIAKILQRTEGAVAVRLLSLGKLNI